MRVLELLFCAAAASACTTTTTAGGGDDDTGGDDQVDAESGDPTEPEVLADECEPFTYVVTYAAGNRTETSYLLAVVPELSPGDDFTVELCDYRVVPAPGPSCPDGATCTGSTGPPGRSCSLMRGMGTFVDGQLVVYCGSRTRAYDAAGTLTSDVEQGYASVSIRR